MKVAIFAQRQRGFTLVEILVTLTIVAVLGSIGFRGFKSAQMRANQAVSAGNLRQLAAANLLYSVDHGTYCPAGDRRNLIRWHGGRTAISGTFDPAEGYLAEYLGESRQVGICPQFKDHLSGADSWENGSGGYGYNSMYIGGLPQDAFTPNRPAAVNNPARTLMFATTALSKSSGVQEYASADPPREVFSSWRLGGQLQPSIHFRFNGKALVAWCDGHVTVETEMEKSSTNFYGGNNEKENIGFCGPSRDNGWWNPRN